MKHAALIASLLVVAGCQTLTAAPDVAPLDPAATITAAEVMSEAEAPRMRGEIIGVTGATIGEIELVEGPHGVLATVAIAPGGLTPGWHGFHIHQVGDCSDVGEFRLSGGHLGMFEGGHGLLNPDGPEIGDLPNIFAHSDGSAAMQFFSADLTFDAIADEDDAAVIMHAFRDDHFSQPIGGAGGRVACGVLAR